MDDSKFQLIPENLKNIESETRKSGFTMPSERKTGSLLRTLAATKPHGHFLELGTGTGLSTAWILSGMNGNASLISVDNDEAVIEIAHYYLGHDNRVSFRRLDGEQFIRQAKPHSFDLIFADAWPGKYKLLDETLGLLRTGGIYIIDDMSPQPSWPEEHKKNVKQLLKKLNGFNHLSVSRLNWSTGIVLCTRLS